METRTTTYGKTVEGRRIEGRRKVTYDDVDGDDLSHGAAGARDGARTTRDKCASGEEVGEELSRKDRGGGVSSVISEVSVSERDVSERDARRRCHSRRQPRGTHRGRTGRWSRGREGREPCCWSCRGCLVGGCVRPCRACVAFCCASSVSRLRQHAAAIPIHRTTRTLNGSSEEIFLDRGEVWRQDGQSEKKPAC